MPLETSPTPTTPAHSTPPNSKVEPNFLTDTFAAPVTLPDVDLSGPGRFFNRELSWLKFNWRVLEEARNPRVPLLERVRFVSISAANLDEFYTVRVAGLRELAQDGRAKPSDDGRSPAEQLALIDTDARALMAEQQTIWSALKDEIEAAGIAVLTREEISDADRA
ncbi:MAG: hypothetical protein AAF825_14420, partial [Pseudomonadota bacterium]